MDSELQDKYKRNKIRLEILTESFNENGTTLVNESFNNTWNTMFSDAMANATTILGESPKESEINLDTSDEDTLKKVVEAQELTIDALNERQKVQGSRGFLFVDSKNGIRKELPGVKVGKVLGQGGMGVVYQGSLDLEKMTVLGLGLIRAGQKAWEIAEQENYGEESVGKMYSLREKLYQEAYNEKRKRIELEDEVRDFYKNKGLEHLANFDAIDVVFKSPKRQLMSQRSVIERFEREQLFAGMVNETITHVIFAGKPYLRPTETPFICMEYLKDIVPYQKVKEKTDAMSKAQILLRAAYSLWSLKKLGVFHRDFKPDNFPITYVKKDNETIWRPKLIDFGLVGMDSKPADSYHTVAGETFLSPRYAAPEQAKQWFESKKKIHVKNEADVFSLGAYMYELFCGRDIHHNIPEANQNPNGISSALYKHEFLPAPAELMTKDLSPFDDRQKQQLDFIVAAALQRDLRERYEHAGLMYEDLYNVIYGGVVASNAVRIKERMGYHNFMAGAYDVPGIIEVFTPEIKPRDTGIIKRVARKLGLK